MAQDQVKPSLSLWDRAVEAVENKWDQFSAAMSFMPKRPTPESDYRIIGATEWRAGSGTLLTRDLVGFDGENYRLGRQNDAGSTHWHNSKFATESDVQTQIDREASERHTPITAIQQRMPDKAVVQAEPKVRENVRELFAPGSARNQKPSGIKPVQGPPAEETIWTRAAAKQDDLFQAAGVVSAPRMKV